MTREEKGQYIDSLAEKFSNTDYFYLVGPNALTVAEVNTFRRMCFEQGVEYTVIKNTLIKKALERLDDDFSGFNDGALKGSTGIMFSAESSNLPAKVLKQFRKDHDDPKEPKMTLKGASIQAALYLGDEQLETLSKLKSKAELLGEIIGLLQSPVQNVLGALESGKHTLAGLVKTLEEREA